ncbi:ankyrin repeat-containing domain protein [Neocallimastix sp. 'constans']|jgi:ankyrin repeat protein
MSNFQIDGYINAIDSYNLNEIKFLLNNNNTNFNSNDDSDSNIHNKDIVFEIYKKGLLTPERLQFIVKNDYRYFKVSSALIKQLIKDNSLDLFDIIISNFRYYDNEFILKLLLLNYKNRMPLSTSELRKSVEHYTLTTQSNQKGITYYYKRSSFDYLINACNHGNFLLVKYLINHGVEVHKQDIWGDTPLFYACTSGNINLVKYLVEEKGADVHKESAGCRTPLFRACYSGNERLVKYLVEEKGADVFKENVRGETPLFRACESGCESLVRYLVEEKGTDVHKEDKFGKTPLFWARESGNKNLVKYLIEEKGATIKNRKSRSRWS